MTIFGIRIALVQTIEAEKYEAVKTAVILSEACQRHNMNQESFWDFLIDREHEQYPLGRFHA